MYKVAQRHKLPVLIHHNISSAQNKEPIYLAEMEDALRRFPDVDFIWAHVGISRRVEVPALPRIAARLLDSHPNLYFDISWVVFDDYITKDEASLTIWTDLFERYPGRFLIGSDAVGHWKNYKDVMGRFKKALSRLTAQTAANLAGSNALEIMNRTRAAR